MRAHRPDGIAPVVCRRPGADWPRKPCRLQFCGLGPLNHGYLTPTGSTSIEICILPHSFVFRSSVNREYAPCLSLSGRCRGGKTFPSAVRYQLPRRASWESREPRHAHRRARIRGPKSRRGRADGRVTVMGAGGGVAANIDRWYQQFTQPDGSSTKERAKVEKERLPARAVTIVDLSGTYMDRPGPMAPGVERPHYRMLGRDHRDEAKRQSFHQVLRSRKNRDGEHRRL